MMILTKQCKVHNETIWKSPYLRKFLGLDLANWSIYMETGESCCLKWSFSLTLSEIPWRFSSILPNVKISLTLCKIPWQFPDLEKFHFSLTFPWRLWTLPLARKWPTWKWTWIWILYGKIEKKCPRYFRRDSRGNPRDLNMCRTGRSAALSRGRKSMPPRRESMKLVVQQRKFT